ncbi:MAG: Holliday junction branch migration protein RuvA [Rhodospirillaceae bacterium]|jgi:Holliday junction DNA helicase RuvA|nr:Holliday junction branch migration protein RuvA [Rhodospirillaceae bacterium]MBT4689476.1 Holliday junction branch migration protein RuvA [Rhodospirillaceae bacterium]MBT5079769.1 Holliday junction branch migration protein RuvA [Rhodospirillaceae bacterium]MBT5523766.1 Holliday junction branch migration protein RuvA [Rhodospirillaceae bacterium]MBT5881620.1 Holliday junction branch migration protein RuvA [Rhodospirillaceae bacterium]
MIAKLSGRLDTCDDNHCIIDVSGVGYLVFCSGRTLSNLGEPGLAVSLLIETHVREDHIHLYGFADAAERDWFKLLLSVQGVGAKVALAILSTLAPGELSQAIVAGDKAMITRSPGVGPKVGTRIVTELKDKVGDLALGPSAVLADGDQPAVAQGPAADAISALVNLGYRPGEAHRAVQTAAAAMGDEVNLQGLIRDSLRQLAS